MIVLQLFDFDAVFTHPHAALQAGIAATAVTGNSLDTIQGRHNAALHPAGIESLVALERPIDLHQHFFEAFQRKAGKTVSQHVVTKGAIGADPAL